MKLLEEFTVPYEVAEVWQFLVQPTAVAGCLPGVESVSVLDEDNVQVRATQSIGPMTATFDANVTVTERVPNELIRFRAIGRSVRGAVGNLRTENTVRLGPTEVGTNVSVEGDVVLAGAIGSVGQKIVAKQAAKVTAEFAANVRRALAGEPMAALASAASGGGVAPPGTAALHAVPPAAALAPGPAPATAAERWAKAATALSALSVVLGILGLLRQRRGARP